MYLQKGSYIWPAGECDVRAHQMPVMAGGKIVGYRRSLDVEGRIYVNGQDDATAKQNLMVAALAIPFQDIVLFCDDNTPSATGLLNAGSISGVLVTRGPHFEKNFGAEYATQRSFSFTAEAEYPLVGTQFAYLSWTESLSFTGGNLNSKFVMRPNLIGPFQKQLVYPSVPFRATQSGHATGYLTYPTPPPPLWPDDEHQELRRIEKHGPERTGPFFVSFRAWGISWSYEFESVNPFVGTPTLWPTGR